MLITLLIYAAIWIAFGFAAGALIWVGMATMRKRARAKMVRSEDSILARGPSTPVIASHQRLRREQRSESDAKPSGPDSAGQSEKLLNFPR